jgi:hypothetical protein
LRIGTAAVEVDSDNLIISESQAVDIVGGDEDIKKGPTA